MMKNFFDTPEKIASLTAAAEAWRGTPFAPHASVRGAGADCVGLVAGIYRDAGFLPQWNFGKYSLDEGRHLNESRITNWFKQRPDFQKLDAAAPLQIGDTLVFRLVRVGHHAGLMLADDKFLHVVQPRTAEFASLKESFYRHAIVEIYRPITPEASSAKP